MKYYTFTVNMEKGEFTFDMGVSKPEYSGMFRKLIIWCNEHEGAIYRTYDSRNYSFWTRNEQMYVVITIAETEALMFKLAFSDRISKQEIKEYAQI